MTDQPEGAVARQGTAEGAGEAAVVAGHFSIAEELRMTQFLEGSVGEHTHDDYKRSGAGHQGRRVRGRGGSQGQAEHPQGGYGRQLGGAGGGRGGPPLDGGLGRLGGSLG